MNRAKSKNTVRLLPFLPDGMVTDRSSPSRVRYAAKNAPLTAPGRSAHPPARKEREILGKANQNLLDADRHSHGRPLHSKPSETSGRVQSNQLLQFGLATFLRLDSPNQLGFRRSPEDHSYLLMKQESFL